MDDPARAFHEAALRQKQPYLEWTAALGAAGPARWFAVPDGPSLWWLSLVGERATFKSDTFDRFVALTGGFGAAPPAPRRSLAGGFFAGLARVFKTATRIAYVKAVMRRSTARRSSLGAKRWVIATYFPNVDSEEVVAGRYVDRYSSALQAALDEHWPGSYGHLCVQVNRDGYGFRDSVRLAARLSRSATLMLVEEFGRLRHVAVVLFRYLRFSAAFAMRAGEIARLCRYPGADGEIDLWPTLRDDLADSFCGPLLAENLWHLSLLGEATRALSPDATVIAVCEMQPWERVLYAAARRRGLRTVGMQHSHVPVLMLSYFSAVAETAWDRDFVEHCPLPDLLGCVGRLPARLFTDATWPDDRVFVWGAQRFESLRDLEDRHVPWREREQRVVVAFSMSPATAISLLRRLAAAFEGAAGLRVQLKAHPALDLEAAARAAGVTLDARLFEFTDSPLETLVPGAKAMIVTETSSSFYGLAAGTPVVVSCDDGVADLNPLSYVTSLPRHAFSPTELGEVCRGILSAEESPMSTEQARAFLADYLDFPPREAYVERLIAAVSGGARA